MITMMLVVGACCALLSLGSSVASAQAPAGPAGMEPGGMMQMQVMDMMKQIAVMMTGGQTAPEPMKVMGQIMAQMAER